MRGQVPPGATFAPPAAPRLLVTGSRSWGDPGRVYRALEEARIELGGPIGVLVSGACPTGADAFSERWASFVGVPIERHPADWSQGRRAGPERNRHMVGLGAQLCLAFVSGSSVGTLGTVRMVERAGIPLRRYDA